MSVWCCFFLLFCWWGLLCSVSIVTSLPAQEHHLNSRKLLSQTPTRRRSFHVGSMTTAASATCHHVGRILFHATHTRCHLALHLPKQRRFSPQSIASFAPVVVTMETSRRQVSHARHVVQNSEKLRACRGSLMHITARARNLLAGAVAVCWSHGGASSIRTVEAASTALGSVRDCAWLFDGGCECALLSLCLVYKLWLTQRGACASVELAFFVCPVQRPRCVPALCRCGTSHEAHTNASPLSPVAVHTQVGLHEQCHPSCRRW